MANYSNNQVRHLYVANHLKSESDAVVVTDKKATIKPATDKDKKNLWFQYRGATDLMRTDLIPVENIMYAKATPADKLKRELMSVNVTLNTEAHGDTVIPGQDYLLNIYIRQYIGMSDRDTTVKFGVVRGTKTMTVPKLYAAMAKSLALNFSREIVPLLGFYVVTKEGTATEVTTSTDLETLTGEYTALQIREVAQTNEWERGVKALEPVYFDVYSSTVTVDGDEIIWAKVEKPVAFGSIHNGMDIADLEYFCMGNRGDIYRNIGWPKTIKTNYLVDESVPYDVIDIHYAYIGNNENPQRSEKDLTIVVPNTEETTDLGTLATSIIAAIKTVSGVEISK